MTGTTKDKDLLTAASDMAAVIRNLENIQARFPEHADHIERALETVRPLQGLFDREFGHFYRSTHYRGEIS